MNIFLKIDIVILSKQEQKVGDEVIFLWEQWLFSLFTSCYYRPQRSCEGYVFTGVCLSTGGSTWAGTTPRDQVHPLGTRYTPSPQTRYTPQDQVHPPGPGTRYTPWTRYTPLDQVHPPGPGTPRRWLTLRTVRILLECILVWWHFIPCCLLSMLQYFVFISLSVI